MKMLIPLVLLLCLLLTSCDASPPPATEPFTEAASDSVTPTETNTVQQEIPTVETSPTEMPATEVPQNNTGVKTDFSHYYSSTSVTPKFTRLSEEPLTDLLPTKNGRQLYPFAGKQKPSTERYDSSGNPIYSYLYGIVDETGCILVDPVYAGVTPLINNSTQEVLPIWVLRKADSYTTGFAAMDGSFVIDCIYDEFYANDGRLIAFHPQQQWDGPIAFDVYDLTGQLLFTSKDFSFGEQLIGPPTNYTYGEGLYTISFANTGQLPSSYRERIYYMNEDGQQVLGPYCGAFAFRDGMAEVFTESDTVYIDKTGAVLPTAYALRYIYPDGTYTVWEDTTPEDAYYRQTTRTTWYDPSGEVLWVRNNSSAMGPHIAFFSSYSNGHAYLENLRTSQICNLPNDTSCFAAGNPLDPILVAQYYDDQIHSYCTRYLTDDFEELGFATSDYNYPKVYEIGAYFQECAVIPEKGTTTVFVAGDTPHATYPVGSFTHFEGYPGKVGAFTDELYTTLYTPEGEVFFSYPVGTMDD